MSSGEVVNEINVIDVILIRLSVIFAFESSGILVRLTFFLRLEGESYVKELIEHWSVWSVQAIDRKIGYVVEYLPKMKHQNFGVILRPPGSNSRKKEIWFKK